MSETLTYSWWMHYLVDQGYLAEMKGAPLSVYCALLRRTDYQFKSCYRTIKNLEIETAYEDRQIRRGIKVLKKLGLIHVVPKINKLGYKYNEYHILHPSQPENATGLQSPEATGHQSPEATGHLSPKATGLQSPLNKNVVNKNNTTTNEPKLIRETTVKEYAAPQDLQTVVAGILNELGLSVEECPNVAKMPVNRVQTIYKRSQGPKIENPTGFFRDAINKGYKFGGKEDREALEYQCDLIRKTATHIKFKNSDNGPSEYEINRFKTGAFLEIITPEKEFSCERFTTEKELEQVIWFKKD